MSEPKPASTLGAVVLPLFLVGLVTRVPLIALCGWRLSMPIETAEHLGRYRGWLIAFVVASWLSDVLATVAFSRLLGAPKSRPSESWPSVLRGLRGQVALILLAAAALWMVTREMISGSSRVLTGASPLITYSWMAVVVTSVLGLATAAVIASRHLRLPPARAA